MKVIRVDNFARETVADKLIEEGLDEVRAMALVNKMNAEQRGTDWWYRAVDDDYRLSRGMEDLV